MCRNAYIFTSIFFFGHMLFSTWFRAWFHFAHLLILHLIWSKWYTYYVESQEDMALYFFMFKIIIINVTGMAVLKMTFVNGDDDGSVDGNDSTFHIIFVKGAFHFIFHLDGAVIQSSSLNGELLVKGLTHEHTMFICAHNTSLLFCFTHLEIFFSCSARKMKQFFA